MAIASDQSLYRQNADRDWVCVLCVQVCKHGIARENHARRHEREGRAVLFGVGGPNSRREHYVEKSALSEMITV